MLTLILEYAPISSNSNLFAREVRMVPKRFTLLRHWVMGLLFFLAAAAPGLAQTRTLTFDELPLLTPLNGVTVQGVIFTYTIGGLPSNDFRVAGGPGTTQFLQSPVGEGDCSGTLTIGFEHPTAILSFGLARSTPVALSPGATVQLFDTGGNLLQTTNLVLTPLVSFAEAQFTYSGTPVRRVLITFAPTGVPFDRFALDNLTYQSGPTAGPGFPFPAASEVSDQKAGSVLYYNFYTSNPAAPGSANTRFTITNTNEDLGGIVHLFFVEGATCSVADRFVCLTRNQTMTFLASEQDPGTTGYLVAVAVDFRGCPVNFNYLIGDEYVKLQTGEFGSLGAESIAALASVPAICDQNTVVTALSFNGVNYNRVPRVLSLSNISSRADGVVTRLVVNRVGGNLSTTAGSIGLIFGVLYNDEEQPHSFSIPFSACQRVGQLDNDFPRTTPRFQQVIPAGQSGWLKLWSTSDVGILGAAIASVPNAQSAAGTFNGAHNLHKLRLTSDAVLIPVFPPAC